MYYLKIFFNYAFKIFLDYFVSFTIIEPFVNCSIIIRDLLYTYHYDFVINIFYIAENLVYINEIFLIIVLCKYDVYHKLDKINLLILEFK